MRRGTAALCAMLVMAPRALAQRDSTAAPAPATGVIEGIAIDSLNTGPLAGAQVLLDGTTRLVLTDSAGRFRVDSLLPGTYRVALFHPVLDSLELSVASPPVVVREHTSATMVLAVPSAESIERAACPERPTPGDSGGGPAVIIGRLLDAESQVGITGGRVALTWNDMEYTKLAGLHHIERTRDAMTGPGGSFQFCWVPMSLSGVLHAARTYAGEVVERPLTIEDRLVQLVTIHAPGTVAANTGASPSGAVLEGRVLRNSGTPVIGARVHVVGTRDSAVTDLNGRFAIDRLPTGTHSAVIRALGYNPRSVPVELAQSAAEHITVTLSEKAVVLKTVTVEAELKAGYHRVGFDRRQAAGFGRFLTEADIVRRSPLEFHDILIGLPGIRVATDRNGELYLTGTRSNPCINYLVDGHQFPQLQPDDIDTYVRPHDIAGIEVYEPGEAPGELIAGPAVHCTTVAIWTKTTLGVF